MNILKLAAAVGLFAMTSAASATIMLSPTGGTATVDFQGGNVAYQGGNLPPNFSAPGALSSVSQTSLSFNPGLSFAAIDLTASGFGTGIRYTQTITNNTLSSWLSYELTIASPSVFFVSLPDAPSFVTVSSGPTVTETPLGGTVVVSNSNRTIDFTFAIPIAPGGSFSIHTPMDGLSGQTSVNLIETATNAPAQPPIDAPEPATLVLLGLGLAGLGFSRRKRQA